MKVYHVAMTRLKWDQIDEYIQEIGAHNWDTEANNGQALVEIAGRLCYKSFEPGLNPNVEKVRTGNKEYIGNLLKQHHGSVLEHVVDSFIVTGVSRVLTHELVRHRHLSVSQESLRYVRIEEVELDEPNLSPELLMFWQTALYGIKRSYRDLLTRIGWATLNFKEKKSITSAIRRLISMGQKTSLMITANARAWRWMIEARTSLGAEEEIRKLFLEIWRQLYLAYPNIYQDSCGTTDGVVHFENSKV